MRNILWLILLITFPYVSIAQKDSSNIENFRIDMDRKLNELSLSIGISQFKYTQLELGISKSKGNISMCYMGTKLENTNASFVWRPDPNDPNLGISITKWITIPFAVFGVNINSFTDFKGNYSTGIQPMLGIGMHYLVVCYGYNISSHKNDVLKINRHNLVLRVLLPFKSTTNTKP